MGIHIHDSGTVFFHDQQDGGERFYKYFAAAKQSGSSSFSRSSAASFCLPVLCTTKLIVCRRTPRRTFDSSRDRGSAAAVCLIITYRRGKQNLARFTAERSAGALQPGTLPKVKIRQRPHKTHPFEVDHVHQVPRPYP